MKTQALDLRPSVHIGFDFRFKLLKFKAPEKELKLHVAERCQALNLNLGTQVKKNCCVHGTYKGKRNEGTRPVPFRLLVQAVSVSRNLYAARLKQMAGRLQKLDPEVKQSSSS